MFSALVDQICDDSARPDRRASVITFVNETCREISRDHDYEADAEEEFLTPDTDGNFVWKPAFGMLCFKRMEFVSYDGDVCCTPRCVRPSARNCELSRFFYRSRDCFFFNGANTSVSLYYYRYDPYLKYLKENDRVLTSDGCEFSGATDAEIAAETNWKISRHRQVVYDGAMSKLMRLTRDPRQQSFYSAFKQGKGDIVAAEGNDELLARR